MTEATGPARDNNELLRLGQKLRPTANEIACLVNDCLLNSWRLHSYSARKYLVILLGNVPADVQFSPLVSPGWWCCPPLHGDGGLPMVCVC